MTKCPKCQAENEDAAKFCTKCGAELTPSESATDTANTATNQTATEATRTETPNTPAAAAETTSAAPAAKPSEAASTVSNPAAATAASQTTAEANPTKPAGKMPNFFSFIIAVMVKPVTALKDKIAQYSNIKNAAIMTVISAAFAMLCSLIAVIFNTVIVKRCSFFGGSCKTVVEWDNLGDLDWLRLTLFNFIAYAIVIALLAGIFFGLSRAFKKTQTNFCRMMTIFAVAIIPMAAALLVGGLLALLSETVGALIISAGSLYGFYIFYEGINNEVELTGDKKIYYNFLSIFALLVLVAILSLIVHENGGGFDAKSMLDFKDLF